MNNIQIKETDLWGIKASELRWSPRLALNIKQLSEWHSKMRAMSQEPAFSNPLHYCLHHVSAAHNHTATSLSLKSLDWSICEKVLLIQDQWITLLLKFFSFKKLRKGKRKLEFFPCPGSQGCCKNQALLQSSKQMIIHNRGQEWRRGKEMRVREFTAEDCISFSQWKKWE